MLDNFAANTSGWLALLVYGLATWRLSYMLVYEDGPFSIIAGLRWLTGIREEQGLTKHVGWMPAVLLCVYCTSVWMAVLLVFMPPALNMVLAGTGVAVIIQRWLSVRGKM